MFKKLNDWLKKAMISPHFEQYDPEDDDETMEQHYGHGREPEEPMVERERPVPPRHERYEAPERQDRPDWREVAVKSAHPKPTSPHGFRSKIVDIYGNPTDAIMHVELYEPVDVNGCIVVTDYIKEGKMCVINLSEVEISQGQRIIDILAGSAYALDGTFTRAGKNVFVVAPNGVRVSDALKDAIVREHARPSFINK